VEAGFTTYMYAAALKMTHARATGGAVDVSAGSRSDDIRSRATLTGRGKTRTSGARIASSSRSRRSARKLDDTFDRELSNRIPLNDDAIRESSGS
jgi:hypothetical protein